MDDPTGGTPADYTPPTQEEWEALQEERKKISEERDNYKEGLLATKKKLKEGKKDEPEFVTKADLEKARERDAVTSMEEKYPELVEKWSEVLKFYAPRKGKENVRDIESDIQDAVDLWKLRNKGKDPDFDKTITAAFGTTAGGKGKENEGDKKTLVKTDADRKFAEQIKQETGKDL